MDLKKCAESKTYADEIAGTVKDAGLEISEISTHLQGQLVAVHPAYARDQARRRGRAVIHVMRRGGADFKKRRAGIEQVRHPVARQHLATRNVPRPGFFTTASGGMGGGSAHVIKRSKVVLSICATTIRVERNLGL